MSDLGIKSRHIGRLLTLGFSLALAGLWASNVPAADFDMTYYLGSVSNDYMTQTEYANANNYIQINAGWNTPPSNLTWYTSGVIISNLPEGQRFVYFKRVTDFYLSDPSNHTFGAVSPILTNLYYPYSNNLTMVITGVVGGVEAPWQLTSYPDEFTNASAFCTSFTNTVELTKIPTGTYAASFNRIVDHYTPTPSSTSINMSAVRVVASTNTYIPYTNSFTIYPCDQDTNDLASATWTISSYTNAFTNSTAYTNQGTTGAGEQTYTKIPTGTYVVTFLPASGYATPTPAAVTNAITDDDAPTFTGMYARITGHLQITMTPSAAASKAPWVITSSPTDFTNSLFGTGNTTISNVPAGDYAVRFDALTGFTTPAATSGVLAIANDTLQLTGAYTTWPRLTVVIYDYINPHDSFATYNLGGVGTGTYTVTGASGTNDGVNWYFEQDTAVTLTAYPTNLVIGTNSYASYFYGWYEMNMENCLSVVSNFMVTMEKHYDPAGDYTYDRTIYLMFSREKYTYDNISDLDGDGMPDLWENNVGISPESPSGTNGAAGNPDNDWIPSTSTNAPARVTISTNLVTSYLAADQTSPGYPLRGSRLYNSQLTQGDGYSRTNIPFNNLLECRGLDVYYQTNGPSGTCADDDPYTNPTIFDTFGDKTSSDGVSDGWRYYFWYWRSTNAYTAGISNSAGLDWVLISPCDDRAFNGSDMEHDTDNDGMTDGAEYIAGTDPTHADTDADSMDDYWESQVFSSVCNPLNYIDGTTNADNDYFACSATLTVLTNGMAGTALSTSVYYVGAAAAPQAAWNDTYTNLGVGRFDLYHDTIIMATGTLTNGATGTCYAHTSYYGTAGGLTGYKSGYPVWVDNDDSGAYSSGDTALVNPLMKHEYVYNYAIASNAFPGVTSFDPRTAWALSAIDTNTHPNTRAYVNYQEYQGGDYLGRVSWDAAGRVPVNGNNDGDGTPSVRTAYTDPANEDTESDLMPDGWELYVGLNPRNAGDANVDLDEDELINQEEWANATHALGSCAATWPNKPWPTDPGFLVAPAPNDPHPKDTDWDGLTDGDERSPGDGTNIYANPTSYDTDGDVLPDGWEFYAGTVVTTNDATADPDGDGLENWREYWTGTVPEWHMSDANWGVSLCARKKMAWDPAEDEDMVGKDVRFIPPDFLSCPSFLYVNGVITDLATLRTSYPAADALEATEYHTTLANNPDSDGDGMDDYWEAYHGLNPLKGKLNLMMPVADSVRADGDGGGSIGITDADPNTDGFQFGTATTVFQSLAAMVAYIGADHGANIPDVIGPFNFGLDLMDPDGDGLPNLEEYSYSTNRVFYHTDPTPVWRTDDYASNSFTTLNYTRDFFDVGDDMPAFWTLQVPAFIHESITEGFDTDNDGVGDYAEINASAGTIGSDPLDARNPIRNRALVFNGTNDFTRTLGGWTIAESSLTRFCVEAWVRPGNPLVQRNQVVVEKAGTYENPYTPSTNIIRANFRMGITNGLPYVMYNGRGALTAYQATAQIAHRLQANVWAHIAGAYDGQNLTIYVNGEASAVTHTTELPANGCFYVVGNKMFGVSHSLMVGARDNIAGSRFYNALIQAVDYFTGCIDEVRVWDGTRSRDQIIANKDRRLTDVEMTNSTIWAYYTFDDVPDPVTEGIVPAGLDTLDTTMSYHPTINWWRDYPLRSTVYTGTAVKAYNYLVSAENHYAHRRILPPPDDPYHYTSTNFSTNTVATNGTYIVPADYRYTSNPYGPRGGTDWIIFQDLVLFNGARGVATNSWLPGLTDDPDSTDADGDGLPDWWEIAHGLDPYSAEGDNGAWGDPDFDGLNNRAEYLAGTNPKMWDTDGDGIGDYDSRSGPGTRTWGELYEDGDSMPDTWEMQYGLDPQHYDADQDLDGDGWDNYSEYQANTDPSDPHSYPNPKVLGSISYAGTKSGTLVILAYQTNTMDGSVVSTNIITGSSIDEVIGYTDGSRYFQGMVPAAPIDTVAQVIISSSWRYGSSDGNVTYTFSGPGVVAVNYDDDRGVNMDGSGQLDYLTGDVNLTWDSRGTPYSGWPITAAYSYTPGVSKYLCQDLNKGSVYLVAFLDENNNYLWDPGEPLGFPNHMPIDLNISSVDGIDINLSDDKLGYGRFAWTASTSYTNAVDVVINRISESGSPTVLTRSMRYPRSYIYEWDYQLDGIYGLSAGSYQWWVGTQNGTFNVQWPSSVSKPYLEYPRGETLVYGRNQIHWTMDRYSTTYHVQIADASATIITNYYALAPNPDAEGLYKDYLPCYMGEWANGAYFYRIASCNPAGESEWSDVQTFNIDLSATNSYWITGDIYYFGKARATNIILEAFLNSGFSGEPDARMNFALPCTTNALKTMFTIRGLRNKTYYVRAFADITPANGGARNGQLDFWESVGFVRNDNNDYRPRGLSLKDTYFVDDTKITIRDRDTDNDHLPDAWEMSYFGNLDQTGDMDYDGDGESNLTEYALDFLDTDPTKFDTDADGLTDYYEHYYDGSADYDPYDAVSNPDGKSLNPTRWDTDGDAYSDGAEIRRYHTDPLDPASHPLYSDGAKSFRPPCYGPCASPSDYDGDGRTDVGIYDPASAMWYLLTWQGQFFSGQFGSATTQPLLGDFDGDGKTDVALYDTPSGTWYVYTWQGQFGSLAFGDAEMIPLPADYDGDFRTDLGVYDVSTGTWYIYSLFSGQFTAFQFGNSACIPVPGDYDGDGKYDFAVYHTADNTWYIYTWRGEFTMFQFGRSGCVPVPGDYDGDGRYDFAVYEAPTATWYIFTWNQQFVSGQFGWDGVIPVSGDYDGDGRRDVAVYYPNAGMWYVYTIAGNSYAGQFGWPAATPVLGGR